MTGRYQESDGKSKVLLSRDEMPKRYYNILVDLPSPLPPPLNPATKEPVGPQDLAPLFPMELIKQEVSGDRFIDIPDTLIDAYFHFGRPTPLFRARRLERALNTPAKIFFKREDLNPTGSHKLNTALAQAYFGANEGVERVVTETGAGQWGSALSLACSHFGLGCQVFMVRCSFDQKPYRKHVMELFGADVSPSPSTKTEFGRMLLEKDPGHPGSLGIAISEAIMTAVQDEATKYSLGSVLNHVLLHQTVIGQEVIRQFEKLDVTPTHMVGCVGGGSNFGGFANPMMSKRIKGEVDTKFMAVEPVVAPTLTDGAYEYDFGDTAETTPLLKMYTLGHKFIPPPIHAGGLRYHGDAPIVSLLRHEGLVDAVAYPQEVTFEAGQLMARTEGVIPAPETCHAIRGAIDLALEAKRKGDKDAVICFNFSGHGLLDLEGYGQFMAGTLAQESVRARPVAQEVR
jgi:tryptophan synthase beta chain